MTANPSKLEWLNADVENPAHSNIKRTLEILDELGQREPLAIEQLLNADQRREKIES